MTEKSTRPPPPAIRGAIFDVGNVLIQLQPLMSVEPGPGVLFFAAVVVLTMIAAESFDPRLVWDSNKEAQRRDG